ncbi:MAG: hypothetical protein ABIV50_16080, partial [Opitutus sp.]
YDTRRWWSYSERFRNVIGQTIAYIYAGPFFRQRDLMTPWPPNVDQGLFLHAKKLRDVGWDIRVHVV